MDVIVESSGVKQRHTSISDRSRMSYQRSGSFLHDSITSSVDFPAYIPWQTLSQDVSERIKQGSVRINRSNCIEWAPTIKEENERAPLLDQLARKFATSTSSSRSEESSGVSKPGVTEAVRGGATWRVGAFLLINAALGAGVLNYPVAYDRIGGLALATFLQVVIVLMLATTMLILVYCSDLNHDSTYHDVLYSMCGKRAQQLAASSIMTTCFGINITFLIIIGDQYDRILATFVGPEFCKDWYFDRRFTIAMTAFITIWPMCYFKRLDFLRYASTLGIFAMFYVIFLNIYEFYTLEVEATIKTAPSNLLEVFAALPVVCFAYQTHEIVVPIYACMAERNLSSFGKSTALALIMLLILYCCAGTFGYLTFGSNVASDILMMYDARDPVVTVGIAALIIKMITTYAPLMFCGRGALDGLYAEFGKLSTEQFINGEKKRRIIITTFWNIAVLALSIITPDITISIELLGSLASCNVFIFPGFCMVSLGRRFKARNLSPCFARLLVIWGYMVILTGAIISGIILVQVVQDMQSNRVEENLCTWSSS